MFPVVSLLMSSLTCFLWFPIVPLAPQPGGINKATFERIKLGMTMAEVKRLIGCRPSAYLQEGEGTIGHWQMSSQAYWLGENCGLLVSCITDWTNHEPIEAVFGATLTDKSTSPPLVMKLPAQDTTPHFLIFLDPAKPSKRVPPPSALQSLAQGR